jgi:hypothetical protein
MRSVTLRKPKAGRIEKLERELSALVAERQELRARLAPPKLLERNRLEIARRQRELSYALIERHAPRRRRAA